MKRQTVFLERRAMGLPPTNRSPRLPGPLLHSILVYNTEHTRVTRGHPSQSRNRFQAVRRAKSAAVDSTRSGWPAEGKTGRHDVGRPGRESASPPRPSRNPSPTVGDRRRVNLCNAPSWAARRGTPPSYHYGGNGRVSSTRGPSRQIRARTRPRPAGWARRAGPPGSLRVDSRIDCVHSSGSPASRAFPGSRVSPSGFTPRGVK